MSREAALGDTKQPDGTDDGTGAIPSTSSSSSSSLSKRPGPYLVVPSRSRSRTSVASTKSPLANPRTPIHRLAVELQSHLHFPDPAPLYAVCGTVIANTMRGYPIWLMLIGPPESGKTELLKPLLRISGCRECGDLSGKAGLLSATRAKDRAADATGGLLHDMPKGVDGGYRGALVMLDFARTVLAADPASMRSTLGAIGMLHDQHYQREVGTDGGQTLSFSGRIGFLAACTDVIDHPDHQQANAEMGERCLYLRYPESDGFHEIGSALDNPDGTGKTKAMADLFWDWSQEIKLNWDEVIPPRDLTVAEKRRIVALAQFCAKGRSGVMRDRYNKQEVHGLSRSALGPRIANSLAQLMRGMERIGCTPEENARVLCQVAMDSLPAIRARVITVLQAQGLQGPQGSEAIGLEAGYVASEIRVSTAATKRTLEDLAVHGITRSNRPDGQGLWTLTEQAEQLLKIGWA